MDETPDNVNESATEANLPPEPVIDAIIKRVFLRRGGVLVPGYSWEDLRQETLLNFMSWLRTGGQASNPAKVLQKLAENHLIDVYRHQTARGRDPRKEENIDDTKFYKPQTVEGDIRGSILMDELREQLSGSDRELFDAYYYQDKTLKEIASERRVSRQAVSGQLSRILKKIRPLMESEFVGTRHRLEKDQGEIERLRDATRSSIEDLQAQ